MVKQYRARGLEPPETDAAIKQDMDALHAMYVQLQQQLRDAEERRAAAIRRRLDEALERLKAERRIAKVAIVSPAPVGDPRTVDLTADLIRAADAQSPLPAGLEGASATRR
jgi:hypothetical protein